MLLGPPRPAQTTASALLAVATVLTLCSCVGGQPDAEPTASIELGTRVVQIDKAVGSWAAATDIADAHRFAEQALNLVEGPDGSHYGDLDRDGEVAGKSGRGLLPGLTELDGIANGDDNDCVQRDVLGGSWDDPTARYAELDAAIAAWTPDNNTYPSLASHPQRIVGWATLALSTDNLDIAREYAGHADLHSTVAEQAVNACGA